MMSSVMPTQAQPNTSVHVAVCDYHAGKRFNQRFRTLTGTTADEFVASLDRKPAKGKVGSLKHRKRPRSKSA